MPIVFGRDIGTARFSARVNLTQVRETSRTVPAGVTQIIWQLDDAMFTDPAESFRLDLAESFDGGNTWTLAISCTYTGGSKGRDGEPPSGLLDLAPGATHLRATLTPLTGAPRVGIFGTVL
jgi:hypothetical protein